MTQTMQPIWRRAATTADAFTSGRERRGLKDIHRLRPRQLSGDDAVDGLARESEPFGELFHGHAFEVMLINRSITFSRVDAAHVRCGASRAICNIFTGFCNVSIEPVQNLYTCGR